MAKHRGISYLRTTRNPVQVLYRNDEAFWIGGSKVLRSSSADVAAVVAAGITVHETLKAYEELKKDDIYIRVVDLYSVKPVDIVTIRQAADDTGCIIVVEDHVPEGGIADAVRATVSKRPVPVHSLAVRKTPKSGKTDELLDFEGISWKAIVSLVRSLYQA
jgi:transketolase